MSWGPLGADPAHTSEPDMKYVEVRLLGVGAGTPTKVLGNGITVGRTVAGVYTLTFAKSPGIWAGALAIGFEATTASDVKNWAVVCTNTSSTVTTVNVYNASAAAADLPAASWLNMVLRYKGVALTVT
jgi:hypothetical protein